MLKKSFVLAKWLSKESNYFFITKQNSKRMLLDLKKYDPILKRHIFFYKKR